MREVEEDGDIVLGGLDRAAAGDDAAAGVLHVRVDGVAEVGRRPYPLLRLGLGREGDPGVALRVRLRLALRDDRAVAVVAVVVAVVGVVVEEVERAREAVRLRPVVPIDAVADMRIRRRDRRSSRPREPWRWSARPAERGRRPA